MATHTSLCVPQDPHARGQLPVENFVDKVQMLMRVLRRPGVEILLALLPAKNRTEVRPLMFINSHMILHALLWHAVLTYAAAC